MRSAASRAGGTPEAGAAAIDPAALAIPAPARRLQGEAAGVVSRVLANAIDLAVAGAVLGVGYLVVCGVVFLWQSTSFTFPTFSRAVVVICAVAVLWTYFTVAWATTGRTYGDHVLGLLVVARSGGRMGLFAAAVRSSCCLAFPIGLLWSAVSRRSASVQDILLGTGVVYAWQGSRLRLLRSRTRSPAGFMPQG